MAEPNHFEASEHWKDPFLFSKLKDKEVNLKEIDEIFRKHHNEFMDDAIWIALRDTVKLLRVEKTEINIGPQARNRLSENHKRIALQLEETLRRMKEAKAASEHIMKTRYGNKAMSNLTQKDIKQWPVFTKIIISLYEYLEQYYIFKAHCPYPSGSEQYKKWKAKYSKELFGDIVGLLKEYYPTYFKNYDENNVKGRLKSYLDKKETLC